MEATATQPVIETPPPVAAPAPTVVEEKPNGKGKHGDAQMSLTGLSPEMVDKLERESVKLHHIEDLRKIKAKRKQEWQSAKETAREAKLAYTEAGDAMDKEIAESGDLLFKAARKSKLKQGEPTTTDTPTASNNADDEEAFNGALLKDLGISGSISEKLDLAEIRNGKQLQAWFAAKCEPPVKGVGEKARDEISDRMREFYEKRAKSQEASTEAKAGPVTASKSDKPRTVGQKNKAAPGEATRGAAVHKARAKLTKEIDARIKLCGLKHTLDSQKVDMRLGVMSMLAGRKIELSTLVTLGEATEWEAKLHDVSDKDVKRAAEGK